MKFKRGDSVIMKDTHRSHDEEPFNRAGRVVASYKMLSWVFYEIEWDDYPETHEIVEELLIPVKMEP